jgi:hypothetical protein
VGCIEQSTPLYPRTYTDILEGLRGVLASIVGSQCLNLPPFLVLHEIFELLESAENLIIGPHEVDPAFSGMVINEGDIVVIPT